MSDAANHLAESATYCRPNDEKRPGLVGLPDFTTSQICPADGTAVPELENAYPDGWYVRVMFDELLDPSIESLTEILDSDGEGTGTFEGSIVDSHPVTLQCESVNGNTLVNVDYDGYYSPSGNSVTWPLGPSLVVVPNDPTLIATNKECQITLNDNITDKDGNPVPADQRGPFKFKIAPISVALIDPSDSGDDTKPTELDALTLFYDNPFIQFNTEVDLDSLCPDADASTDPGSGLCDSKVFEFTNESGTCDVTEAACKSMADCGAGDTLCGKGYCNASGTACNKDTDCATGEHCDSVYAYDYFSVGADPTHQQYGVGPVNPIPADVTGEFHFLAGAVLKDRCGSETTLEAGSPDTNTAFKYKTNAFKLNRINIADGETSAANKKPDVFFNNVVDFSSLKLTDYTISPAPTIPPTTTACTPATVDTACVAGLGAECVSNVCVYHYATTSGGGGDFIFRGHYQPDTPYTLTIKAGTKVKDFYGDEHAFEEDTVINWKTAKITLGTTTADNATVVKSTPTSNVGVSLAFNQGMVASSFDANTDYTVVDSSGAAQTMTVAVSTTGSANCSASSLSCTITIRANLAPGAYTFTLKQGAQLLDALGNTYTQAADKVIHFTVEDAEPSPAVQCL
ncbi:MAG: hypothetical protein HOV81_26185 [Kofleriaceae bacterium]|nr:hypothetical protein [Kofleriaceae bacterium]